MTNWSSVPRYWVDQADLFATSNLDVPEGSFDPLCKPIEVRLAADFDALSAERQRLEERVTMLETEAGYHEATDVIQQLTSQRDEALAKWTQAEERVKKLEAGGETNADCLIMGSGIAVPHDSILYQRIVELCCGRLHRLALYRQRDAALAKLAQAEERAMPADAMHIKLAKVKRGIEQLITQRDEALAKLAQDEQKDTDKG